MSDRQIIKKCFPALMNVPFDSTQLEQSLASFAPLSIPKLKKRIYYRGECYPVLNWDLPLGEFLGEKR